MQAGCPEPLTADSEAQLFDSVGVLLNDSFTYAKRLGHMTCVGTEVVFDLSLHHTPLTPAPAQAPLAKPAGASGNHSAEDYYSGIFDRVVKSMPVDYYWIWTPEQWASRSTPNGVESPDVKQMTDDFLAAHQAYTKGACVILFLDTCFLMWP